MKEEEEMDVWRICRGCAKRISSRMRSGRRKRSRRVLKEYRSTSVIRNSAPRRTLPQAYAYGSTAVLGGGGGSYK